MSEPVPLVLVPGFYGYACEDGEIDPQSTPSELLTQLWLSVLEGREDRPSSYQIALPPEGVITRAMPPDPSIEALVAAFPEHFAAERLSLFAYDWRQDLTASAARLAAELIELDRMEIDLVAVGPGGLIVRYLVESGTLRHAADRIRRIVLLGCPNSGMPIGLPLIQGVFGIFDSTTALEDLARGFPSAVQMLPPRGVSYVYLEGQPGVRIEPFAWPEAFFGEGEDDSKFSATLAEQMIRRNESLHAPLKASFDPSWRRCLAFASSSEATVADLHLELIDGRVNWKAVARDRGAGDGLVPVWSALSHPSMRSFIAIGPHLQICEVERVRARMGAFLSGQLS